MCGIWLWVFNSALRRFAIRKCSFIAWYLTQISNNCSVKLHSMFLSVWDLPLLCKILACCYMIRTTETLYHQYFIMIRGSKFIVERVCYKSPLMWLSWCSSGAVAMSWRRTGKIRSLIFIKHDSLKLYTNDEPSKRRSDTAWTELYMKRSRSARRWMIKEKSFMTKQCDWIAL